MKIWMCNGRGGKRDKTRSCTMKPICKKIRILKRKEFFTRSEIIMEAVANVLSQRADITDSSWLTTVVEPGIAIVHHDVHLPRHPCDWTWFYLWQLLSEYHGDEANPFIPVFVFWPERNAVIWPWGCVKPSELWNKVIWSFGGICCDVKRSLKDQLLSEDDW